MSQPALESHPASSSSHLHSQEVQEQEPNNPQEILQVQPPQVSNTPQKDVI